MNIESKAGSVDWLDSAALSFMAYAPYETFCEQLQPIFVNRTGAPACKANNNPDIEALWRVGHDAYNLLNIQSKDDFTKRYSLFVEAIKNFRGIVRLLVTRERMVDQDGQLVTLESLALQDREASEILSLVWPIVQEGKKTSRKEVTLKAEHFLFACLREIDNALIGMELDGRSAVSATVWAVTALANAQAIELGNDQLKTARSKLASAGAFARHRNDPKQAEKRFVHECYLRWRSGKATYRSKAQFARDMLDKCSHLGSSKKIEDWVRQWDKQKQGFGTLPAG